MIFVPFVALTFIGCGEPSIPKPPVTSQLNFSGVEFFELAQTHNSKIVYHTEDELRDILNEKLTDQLSSKENITDKPADKLQIEVSYYRLFVGEATPLKTDSLGHPIFNYNITIVNNNGTILREMTRKFTADGGFLINLQIVAGQLRDKKYEVDFVDILAEDLAISVQQLIN